MLNIIDHVTYKGSSHLKLIEMPPSSYVWGFRDTRKYLRKCWIRL